MHVVYEKLAIIDEYLVHHSHCCTEIKCRQHSRRAEALINMKRSYLPFARYSRSNGLLEAQTPTPSPFLHFLVSHLVTPKDIAIKR